MRRPELRVAAVACLLVLATGCSSMSRKFTFMRPDLPRPKATRVAPVYDVSGGKRGPDHLRANERLVLANARLREGRYADAQSEARAALKQDPRSADAYAVLAVAADAQGKAPQAGQYYAKAVELAPTNGLSLNNYGAWLCSNGRAPESLALFDRALADPRYPTPASAHANAGTCAIQAGQPARAERDLRQALALVPTEATALGAMAGLEFDAGRDLQARAFVERRLAAAPADAPTLRLASRIEQRLGDNAAAARYAQRLASEFPSESVDGPAGDRGRP